MTNTKRHKIQEGDKYVLFFFMAALQQPINQDSFFFFGISSYFACKMLGMGERRPPHPKNESLELDYY